MKMLFEQKKLPDVSVEQRASDELVKLIRKLRWVGMEAEAKQAEMAVCSLTPERPGNGLTWDAKAVERYRM